MNSTVLVLGCGFTGSTVAGLLEAKGVPVTRIRSSDIDFTQPGACAVLRRVATPGCLVLHSIPSLPERADAKLLDALAGLASRVVYLSTTGVYGDASIVNEQTPTQVHPRLDTEAAVTQGLWEALILRPAAIYGPGRGVHVSMQEGRYKLLGDGSNYISRIHVDDLAALCAEALLTHLTGAYPVADEHPCASREIAEYCAKLLSLPMPESAPVSGVPVSRRGNRRVDGSALCAALGVKLRYPSYREGIPASIR